MINAPTGSYEAAWKPAYRLALCPLRAARYDLVGWIRASEPSCHDVPQETPGALPWWVRLDCEVGKYARAAFSPAEVVKLRAQSFARRRARQMSREMKWTQGGEMVPPMAYLSMFGNSCFHQAVAS